jgi:hypothetical protein
MRGLIARAGLAGLAASLLIHPAVAQNAQEPAAPPPLVFVEAESATPEQQRAADAAQAEYHKSVRERGIFGVFLLELDQPRRAIACGKIAEYLASGASAAADPRERAERLKPAWRLSQRVAAERERALQSLTEREIARLENELGQAMTMSSLVPDPQYAQVALDTSEGGFAYQFGSMHALRCHQSLDENGVPDDASEPTREYIDQHTRFRFRGMDYEAAFAGTQLGPYAQTICRNQADFDFTDAPLDQRGHEGMSLLDWATECEDRAAFDALIAAGFDLDAPGLWKSPPVVNSATEKRLWYLTRLLDSGASPDAVGAGRSALEVATSDLDAINFRGDPRAAFNLLRARGASLNFPDFQGSMWLQWGLHDRNEGWALILQHWDEFASDPVEMASLAESVLEGHLNWMNDQKDKAAKVKALLIAQYGVCFPVGRPYEMAKDERGFRMQPDCPTRR